MASLVSLKERNNMRVSKSMARTRLIPDRVERRPVEKADAPLATEPGDRCLCLELREPREPREPRDPREPEERALPRDTTDRDDLPVARRLRLRSDGVCRSPNTAGVMAADSPRIIRVSSRVRAAVDGADLLLLNRRARCVLAVCRFARRSFTTSRMLSASASCSATSGVMMPVRDTVLTRPRMVSRKLQFFFPVG